MKSSLIPPQSSKFNAIFWQTLCLAISILAFCMVLSNRSDNALRKISIAAHTDFFPVIPILAVVLYISFRLPSKLGKLTSITATFILFALPISGLWASGHTLTTSLNGVIPMGDARIYYSDALRLTNGELLSSFSARRPLFTGLLGFFLFITNYNLMISLAIFTALTAFSAYLVVTEIQKSFGFEVSTFTLIMIFLFYRLHSGTAMTENLGTPIGLLGFALLWKGTVRKNLWLVSIGILTTTLALNIRAGAFFILPMLIIWAGWTFYEKDKSFWNPVFLTTIAVVLGFTLNLTVTKVIAQSSSMPFGNFSYSLYGLASGGKSWFYIYEQHPEVFKLSEPEHSRAVYRLTFELMHAHPLLTLQGAIFNWKMLFSGTLYGLYSYVAHENWDINPFIKWTLYLLAIIGIYDCIRDFRNPVKSMLIASIVGFLLSIPFAPPIDTFRMRQFAASVAIMVLPPALGIKVLLPRKLSFFKVIHNGNTDHPWFLISFTILIIATTLISPIVILKNSVKEVLPIAKCKSSQSSILIRIDEGSYINIHGQHDEFLDWAPDFHLELFRRNAHTISDGNMINWLEKLPSGNTLTMTVDRIKSSSVLVVISTELANKYIGHIFQACGSFELDPGLKFYKNIFYVEEVVGYDKFR